jgi:putative ABC transport system permease protein
MFVSAAQTATLHRQVQSDCPGRSGATVTNKVIGGADGFAAQRSVTERAAAAVPNLAPGVVSVTADQSVTFVAAVGSTSSVFVGRQGFLDHIDVMTRADVPTGVPTVWVPDDVAAQLGVRAGDRMTATGQANPLPVVVAGTYRDMRYLKADSYWCSVRPLYQVLDPFAKALPPLILADVDTVVTVVDAVQAPAADDMFEFPLADDSPDRATARRTVAALPALLPAIRDGLGSDQAQFLSVTSALPRFAQRSDLVASSLRLPIYAVSGAAVLVGLFVIGAATLLWSRRRRHELVVLAVHGSSPAGIGGKAVLEAAPALLAGAATAWFSSRTFAGWLSPADRVDPQMLIAGGIAAVAVLAAGLVTVSAVAAHRCRRLVDPRPRTAPGWRSLVPWELVPLAAALPLWHVLGGATRESGAADTFTGAVVELPGRDFLVPIIVIVAGATFVARAATVALRRRGQRYTPSGHARFLAWRRLVRDPIVVAALLVATIVTASLAGYGAAVTATVQATVAAKARAVTGADVVVDTDQPATAATGVPTAIAADDAATVVGRTDSVQLASITLSLLAVDPEEFTKVAPIGDLLAGRPVADALRPTSSGQPPTIVATAPVPSGIRQLRTSTGVTWTVRVISVPDLPGRHGGEPLAIAARASVPPAVLADAHTAIWIHTDRPQQVAAAAAGLSGARAVTIADDIFVGTLYEPVTYTFGYFVAVAVLTAVIVVVGLLLHLEARSVGHRRAYIHLRRMGMRARTHRAALLWEFGSILGTGLVISVGAVILLINALRSGLDVDPSIPPGAVLTLPIAAFTITVAAAAFTAITASGYAHARVASAKPAEVLRDAN